MNRSQSTVSYAIGNLQERFQVPLLELKGRKTHLTEVGRELLGEVEPLLSGFRALERRAASLATNGKSQIRLSVDSFYPSERLFAAIAEFTRSFPDVLPQLRKGHFLSSAHEFTTFRADLCISELTSREQFAKPVLDIRMRAVARPDHPLHVGTRQLTHADLIQNLAAVIEGGLELGPMRLPQGLAQRTIALSNIDDVIEAVRSGVSFGWLPVYKIKPLLASGELVPLRLPLGSDRFVRLFLVMKDIDSAGRERNFIGDLLGANRELEVI